MALGLLCRKMGSLGWSLTIHKSKNYICLVSVSDAFLSLGFADPGATVPSQGSRIPRDGSELV